MSPSRLFCIKFSDGSHGALLSQEQARAAYDRIDSDRRALCSVTTWTEGTREEIVRGFLEEQREALRIEARALDSDSHKWDERVAITALLLMLSKKEPCAETLRPPRDEQVTLTEEK